VSAEEEGRVGAARPELGRQDDRVTVEGIEVMERFPHRAWPFTNRMPTRHSARIEACRPKFGAVTLRIPSYEPRGVEAADGIGREER
jgi:hypothetical protein